MKCRIILIFSSFCPIKFFFKTFYWSIDGLQCCVSFRCTAKSFSFIHIYIFFQTLFHNSSPQIFLSHAFKGNYQRMCLLLSRSKLLRKRIQHRGEVKRVQRMMQRKDESCSQAETASSADQSNGMEGSRKESRWVI